jgi:hypothetical protein
LLRGVARKILADNAPTNGRLSHFAADSKLDAVPDPGGGMRASVRTLENPACINKYLPIEEAGCVAEPRDQ